MDPLSIVVVALIVIAAVWLLFRLKGASRNPPKLRVAMELISHIDENYKILNQKQSDPKSLKRFKTGSWKSYQEHLDFLEKGDIEIVTAAFNKLEDYNNKIIASYDTSNPNPPELSFQEMKESLAKARSGLAKWVRENIGRESTRGMFSWR